MFVGEFIDRNVTAESNKVFPNTRLMVAVNFDMMKQYTSYLEQLASTDFTDESIFLGNASRWCKSEIDKNNIKLIKCEMLGAVDTDKQLITIERLLGSSYVDICADAAGLYIPEKEILSRIAYKWFGRMNANKFRIRYSNRKITLSQQSCSTINLIFLT